MCSSDLVLVGIPLGVRRLAALLVRNHSGGTERDHPEVKVVPVADVVEGLARPGVAAVEDGAGDRYDLDLGVVAFGSAGMIPDRESREPTYTEWYADENAAAEAAAQLELDRLVPTHWDMWKGLTADPTALRPHVRSYDHPERLERLEIGDSTAL